MAKLPTIIGIIIIIYGAAGLLASLFLMDTAYRYQPPTLDLSSVKQEFDFMSASMLDASQAATNAGVSIRNARRTLYSASDSSDSAGQSIYNVAGYVGFDVFGWQPFEDTYYLFTNTGNNLKTLSSQITTTADHLEQNARDMDRMGADFYQMSTKLTEVGGKLNGGKTAAIPVYTKMGVLILLGYLCLLHFIITLIGVALFTIGRRIHDH